MNTFGHPSYRLVDTYHSTDPLDSGRGGYSVSLGSSFRADNRIHLYSNDYRIETKKSKDIKILSIFFCSGNITFMFVFRGWEHEPTEWLVTWFMVVTWPISVRFQGWKPGLIYRSLNGYVICDRHVTDSWIEHSTDEDSLILTTPKYLSQSIFALKENFLDKIRKLFKRNISQTSLLRYTTVDSQFAGFDLREVP